MRKLIVFTQRDLTSCSLYLVATAAILTSCYPASNIPDPYVVDNSRQKKNIYYVPSAPNTPLLSNKNDLNFNLLRTATSPINGFEVQAAYLPAKHVGIIGRYSFAKDEKDDRDYPDYMKYRSFEIGAGYVNQFYKDFHFETYAGIGKGKIANTHHTGFSNLNLTHYFIQPTLAVNNPNKTVQFAFVSRFAGVNFKIADMTFDNLREPLSAAQLKSLDEKPFHVFWEPGLVLRFGWKEFLFHSGYSYSSDLTNSDLRRSEAVFSFGASLRLNTTKKTITKN